MAKKNKKKKQELKVGFKIKNFSLIFIIGLFLDQWSKYLAISFLKGANNLSFFGGWVRFIYAENKGAWGSLGSNWSLLERVFVFKTLPVLITVALFYYIFFKEKDRIFFYLFSFVFTGAIGNIVDRIHLDYVVDFILLGKGALSTHIFNIADVYITIAVIIMFFYEISTKKIIPKSFKYIKKIFKK